MSARMADRRKRRIISLEMPPTPTTTRTYFPAPAMPATNSQAIVKSDAGDTQPVKAGLVDWVIEGVKERAPELAANAAATKANFSQTGLVFWKALNAPISFALSVVAASVSALTRGQGLVGEWSTRVAVGSAHATVAELSRPQQPAQGAEAPTTLPAQPGTVETSAP